MVEQMKEITKSLIRFVVILMFFVWLLFLSVAVFAVEKTLTWQAPTKRVDGSALLATDIKGYQTRYADADDSSIAFKDIGFTADIKMVVDVAAIGNVCFQVRTVAVQNDLTSAWSNKVCTVIDQALPGAPVLNLGELPPIEQNLPGFEIAGEINLNALNYIGIVPGPSESMWAKVTLGGVEAMQAPTAAKAPLFYNNARLDYEIRPSGGIYEVIFLGYAKDGLTDSLYLAINGAPIPGLNETGIFAPTEPRNAWAASRVQQIRLNPGAQVLNVIKRDPSYAIAEIKLKKIGE